MGTRRLNGTYVQTRLATDLPPLPNDFLVLLKEAVSCGSLHLSTFWRKRSFFQERELDEWRQSFEQTSNGNPAIVHFSMACFLMQLCNDAVRRHFRRRQIDRYFIVCAIIQRELTLACLSTPDEDLRHFRKWCVEIGLDKNLWFSSYLGANSVARAAHLLMLEGYDTYLPTASIDCNWKIDLIARNPKLRQGVCFQIKTVRSKKLIRYRVLEPAETQDYELPIHHEILFREGVERFSNQNPGKWTAVDLGVSIISYEQGAVVPCNSMRDSARSMFNTVFNPETQQPQPARPN